jgi:hypothetical protein
VRARVPELLEAGRVRDGCGYHPSLVSDARSGLNGAFKIIGPMGRELRIIASDNDDWEHVSVSVENRPPNWAEMCRVKDLFWNDEELVIQIHPPRSEYVNHHPYCLHLWKPIGIVLPMPPSHLVGPK